VLKLSKKMLFAIEAVLDIAYHANGETVQSREITQRQGIPRRYLEQALQQLVRNGILVGVRGPHGGYRLAKERRRTTVGEIVRVVHGMETADDPLTDDFGSPLAQMVVRPLWSELQENVMQRLESVTIEDLCSRAGSAGIRSDTKEDLDFSI
jgi:Rrf2 family transcriptional regulator, iron-sulfur cluster assembly transcription factor